MDVKEQRDSKNILGLQLPTDPRWVDLASISLQEILTDHAYCEQKAATSCISLIQRYPDKEKLVKELSPIVTEEWGHFRMVMESEAGHYHLFIDLAETYIEKPKVRRRWKEWLEYEAGVIGGLEVRGDRMH